MKSPDFVARKTIVVLAPLPFTRGDFASWSGNTMSCSVPSPLIKVSCTICPSAAVRTGFAFPSIEPPTPRKTIFPSAIPVRKVYFASVK